MTLTARNTVSIIGFIAALAFLIIFIFILVLLHFRFDLFSGDVYEVDIVGTVVVPLFLAVFSVGGWLFVRLSFQKTSSAEVFFFSFFLLSLSFETLKVIQLLFLLQSRPFLFNVLITRVVFFGRFFGLLCLFFSGMFSSWLQYQRIGLVLSISLLVPVALALVIPVSTDMGEDLLFTLGIRREMGMVFYAIEAFAVLNYIISGVVLNSREYFWMSGGILTILIGREFLFQSDSLVLSLCGIGLVTAGSLLFGKKAHTVYLWR